MGVSCVGCIGRHTVVAAITEGSNEELLSDDREHKEEEKYQETDVNKAADGDEQAPNHLLEAFEVLDEEDPEVPWPCQRG